MPAPLQLPLVLTCPAAGGGTRLNIHSHSQTTTTSLAGAELDTSSARRRRLRNSLTPFHRRPAASRRDKYQSSLARDTWSLSVAALVPAPPSPPRYFPWSLKQTTMLGIMFFHSNSRNDTSRGAAHDSPNEPAQLSRGVARTAALMPIIFWWRDY